jgi:hypothetical protein
MAGVLGDYFMRNKHFLQILFINCILLGLDIFLFFNPQSLNDFDKFYYFVGFALASNDLIYLILMPMLIAKTHSENMAANSRFQRICYAGTIAGVVLALCTVGKYLFSENLASFLIFVCNPHSTTSPHQWINDIVAVLLLAASNLVIYNQIQRDVRRTDCYQKRYGNPKISLSEYQSYQPGGIEKTESVDSNRKGSGQLLQDKGMADSYY